MNEANMSVHPGRKTPADIIAELESTDGRLDKERIIAQAWHDGVHEFFTGAQMAYDSLRTYGVKKVPLIETSKDHSNPAGGRLLDWQGFVQLATQLERRELTGNRARDALHAASDQCQVRDWNGFYRRILLKDLKCGVTRITINKVLSQLGPEAQPYIIPVFSCQLAKNGEDHPKKMVGPKLLDIKLDGVRILSFLDKELNTVTQYSRDGRINENFPHIAAQLARLLPHLSKSMVLDGEMVSRSFQALMTQLNRKSNVDTSDASLALFDVLPMEDFIAGECKLSQTARHEALVDLIPLLSGISQGSIYVVPKMSVDLDTVDGQAALRRFNMDTIEAGYEGVMVKDPNATYQTQRTDAWMKIKPWITVDLEVVGFEPGKSESRFAHTLGALICRGTDQGREIEVSVGGGYTEELRDEIWANQDQVLGRIVEIKGDGLTKNNHAGSAWSLRFPVFLGFRGDTPGEKS